MVVEPKFCRGQSILSHSAVSFAGLFTFELFETEESLAVIGSLGALGELVFGLCPVGIPANKSSIVAVGNGTDECI